MKSSGVKLNWCGGCKLPTYAGGVPQTPLITNLITNQVEKARRIPGDLSRESMARKSSLPGSGANCSRPCGGNPKQSPISSEGTPASQQLLLSRWLSATPMVSTVFRSRQTLSTLPHSQPATPHVALTTSITALTMHK